MKTYKQKHLTFEVKEVDKENYIVRGVFSTPDVDRHGEIVDQMGWKIGDYMKNPVVLFAHDQYQPPVAQMIELSVEGGVLQGAMQFAVEEYDFAKTIFNLYAGKFMRAFSVGFDCEVWEYNEENEQVILKENTLLEVSCVNVPANQLALAKSKGIDVRPIEKKIERAKSVAEKVLHKGGLDANEEGSDTEISNDSALGHLKSQQADIIKSAIGELQSAYNSLTADEGKHPQTRSKAQQKSKKKQVKKSLNRAIRKLLKAKN